MPSIISMHGRNHLPNGSDPIDLFGTPSLSSIILAEPCLSGFWKLNETSGDGAADSSSGGHNMVSGAGDPPTWAAALSPFGENAAEFDSSDIEESTAFGALTGDFSLEIWCKRLTSGSGGGALMTQGDPVPANHAGVAMYWLNSGSANQIVGYVGDSTGGPHVVGGSGTNYSASAWHHVVMVRASSVWKIYVDAAQNGSSYNDSGTNYDSSTGMALGGKQGSGIADVFPGYLSYAASYNCALSEDDILLHYTAGVSPGSAPAGWVWTTDGTSAYWAAPTIQVEFS